MEGMISQEQDYGTEMHLQARAPINTTTHPIEASERTYKKRQEELRMTSAARIFGMGFALHLKHERAAVSICFLFKLSILLISYLDFFEKNSNMVCFVHSLAVFKKV